jgi:hypothetical protein
MAVVDEKVDPVHTLLLEDSIVGLPLPFSGTSAIFAKLAAQPLGTPPCEVDPYHADTRPPRHRGPIGGAMLGMAPPILGIHPCQSRVPDHQEILAVLLFCGERPIL